MEFINKSLIFHFFIFIIAKNVKISLLGLLINSKLIHQNYYFIKISIIHLFVSFIFISIDLILFSCVN